MARESILVIEDEPGISDFLVRGLQAEGYAVAAAADGLTGSRYALNRPIDLVILDMMLPQRSGPDVLADLRAAKPEVPVVVLTARGEVEERVAGLNAGAVDYIVKPFSLAELKARVRAHLRFAAQGTPTTLQGNGITVDLLSRDVRVEGDPVRLSVTEFDLLCHLMRNPGRVLAREDILRVVWGYEHDPATNVVDVYIGYLRRKLRLPGRDSPIVTVRSVGYRFDAG